MADAMVTGRMTPAKKEAGNRVLRSLGLNASQAINQMYDHLIDKGSLPFERQRKGEYSKAQIEEARAYARSIPKRNAFSEMADEEIKAHKIKHRYGLNV